MSTCWCTRASGTTPAATQHERTPVQVANLFVGLAHPARQWAQQRAAQHVQQILALFGASFKLMLLRPGVMTEASRKQRIKRETAHTWARLLRVAAGKHGIH